MERDESVVAVMLTATIIATVYSALIAMHVLAVRGGERYRPWIVRWLAATDERRRGRAESDAADRLMAGSLDRASYPLGPGRYGRAGRDRAPDEMPRTM